MPTKENWQQSARLSRRAPKPRNSPKMKAELGHDPSRCHRCGCCSWHPHNGYCMGLCDAQGWHAGDYQTLDIQLKAEPLTRIAEFLVNECGAETDFMRAGESWFDTEAALKSELGYLVFAMRQVEAINLRQAEKDNGSSINLGGGCPDSVGNLGGSEADSRDGGRGSGDCSHDEEQG